MDGKIVQKLQPNGKWEVGLVSNIDEGVDFPVPPASLKEVDIDLGEVTYINSTGIRNWVLWIVRVINQTPQKNVKISRIPLSFIRAATLIQEVLPNPKQVQSFYVNYYCPACSFESSVLVDNSKNTGIPNLDCEKCGARMDLELPFNNYAKLMNP